MKHKVLVVDDEPGIMELIEIALEDQNFEIISASNGKEALQFFKKEPTLVILSDLNMPDMDGRELLLNIQESGYSPVFIMLTSETDVNTVIDLFKKGIYDYIMKPFNPKELVNRLEKAFELAELRSMKENIQKERDIRIESMLNWNIYKENLIKRDSDKVDSNLMTNMNTSLFQGAGIGNLSSIFSLIQKSTSPEIKGYVIDEDVYNLLLENVQYSNKLLDMVGEINKAINVPLPKKECSIDQLHTIIERSVDAVAVLKRLHKHNIVLAKNIYSSNPKRLFLNEEYIEKAILELLYNAFKFSEPNTKIYILYEIVKENFLISFLSTPNDRNLIGDKYQNVIFEPFFRISHYIYDSFPTLDCGLGLCFVEKIIRNHEGNIRFSNIKNNLEDSNRLLADFCIELPLKIPN
ncbi:MAG: response regulator [Leptospira sp.]|nr:response regulator [Leptospira sp.]